MKHDYLPLFLYLLTFGYVKYAEADDQYCYADDAAPYIQFSTKSAYELVRARTKTNSHTSTIPSCKPVMIWASIRHGTRYPSRRTIEEMKTLLDVRDVIIKNHEEYKYGQLCAKDLRNLKNYSFVLSPNYEFKLSTQGKDDLRYLAKRVKSQFANVLDATYSSSRFAFYNDGTERTVESTNAFFQGLFGTDIGDVHMNNSLLRSADTCNTWVKQVKNNSETYKQYELFKNSKYMHNLIAEVDYRLGFKNNLTFDVIELMYDTCRYEKAWYIGSRPPFCCVFSKENLKVLEYLQDLKYYYEYSYGNDLNKRLACPLVADMVKRFNDAAEGNNKGVAKPVGLFYFSHSAVHLPSVTLLKLKEDIEHLLHNNYESMSRREFMTSIIDPFSANLVIALYKCTEGEENRVIFYLNEDPLRLPGCESGLCPWKHVYEKLKPVVESNDCNFEFCNSAGSALRITSILMCIPFAISYYLKVLVEF